MLKIACRFVPGAASTVPPTERNLLETKVPESKDYELVYDLDLSKLGRYYHDGLITTRRFKNPSIASSISMELQRATRHPLCLLMHSPTIWENRRANSGITGPFPERRQAQCHLLTLSMAWPGWRPGLDGGNIEFWPNNYAPNNKRQSAQRRRQKIRFWRSARRSRRWLRQHADSQPQRQTDALFIEQLE